MKFKDIKKILLSRVTVIFNRKPYVRERRQICNNCPYNSKNGKIGSVRDAMLVLANTFTRYCTACGCGIAFKTSVPSAECGLAEIGKEPKWREHEK